MLKCENCLNNLFKSRNEASKNQDELQCHIVKCDNGYCENAENEFCFKNLTHSEFKLWRTTR